VLGGIGAWAASAIGRASPAAATDGDILHVGDDLTATAVTKLTNSTTGDTVLEGESASGIAVQGTSGSGAGVVGFCTSNAGVIGGSTSSVGVRGDSSSFIGVWGASGGTGTVGQSSGNNTGVHGHSGSGALPGAKAKTGVYGYAAQDANSRGVHGESPSGFGVQGTGAVIGVYGTGASIGVNGYSDTDIGLYGDSSAIDAPATFSQSYGNFTGILGYSGGFEAPPAGKAKTGIYGYAQQDTASKGVWGASPAGHGIHGESSSGWAGYFDGRVLVKQYVELKEIGTPSAPGSNYAKLFIRDNGSGKTQLCVRFHTGAVKVLATQS
jgi:hypothetical protein